MSILTLRLSFHCIHTAQYFRQYATFFSPTLDFTFKVSFGNHFQSFLTVLITSVDHFRSSSKSSIQECQLSIYKHLPSSNIFFARVMTILVLLGTDIYYLHQCIVPSISYRVPNVTRRCLGQHKRLHTKTYSLCFDVLLPTKSTLPKEQCFINRSFTFKSEK